jgi:hypothetical protein
MSPRELDRLITAWVQHYSGTKSEVAEWAAEREAFTAEVSRSWVYQKAEAGLLPYLKVGGLVRFVPERIREFALRSSNDSQPFAMRNR